MITKGYVVKQTSENKYLVRIPVLNSVEGSKHSTPDAELSEAILSTLPAASNVLHEGDCVIVGFENNDFGYPIILGHLFAESINNTPIDLCVRHLDVSKDSASRAELPYNTTIGKVTAEEISNLEGCNLNIIKTFYNTRYYFTDREDDNPEKIYIGTTWERLPDTTSFGAFVWHRIS